MVPLLGRERLEEVGEVASFVGGELHTLGHSSAVGERGVPVEVERPPVGGLEAAPESLPAVTVAIEVAVLKDDASVIVVEGGERDLDLAGSVGISLELPVGRDPPGE